MAQPGSLPRGDAGRMTAVMRAVAPPEGRRVLRIAVVERGRIVDEHHHHGHVTMGSDEDADILIPGGGATVRLFERRGARVVLHPPAASTGRVQVHGDDLEWSADETRVFSLDGDARGRLVVGDTTLLFQLVLPPPAPAQPPLPEGVERGWTLDWRTTILASFSFLVHFMALATLYSDWMDPEVADHYVVSRIVERAEVVPQPVEALPVEAPLDEKKAEVAPEKERKSSETAPTRSKGRERPSPPVPRESADAAAERLAGMLGEMEVQKLGVRGGPALDGVLDEDASIPQQALEEAAKNGSVVDDDGLKIDGRASREERPGQHERLNQVGRRDGDEDASEAGVSQEVAGPTARVAASTDAGGGEVANASSVVARMSGRFRRCYQAGLDGDPTLAGSVVLMAKVGPDGGVLGVSGGGGGLGAIVPCLKAVVAGAPFSAPKGGKAVMVSIPITFLRVGG